MSNPFSCNPFGGGGGGGGSLGAAFDGETIFAIDDGGTHTVTSDKIHTLTIAAETGPDLTNFTLTFALTGGEGQVVTIYANQNISPMMVLGMISGAWTSMLAGETYQVVKTGYGVVRVL